MKLTTHIHLIRQILKGQSSTSTRQLKPVVGCSAGLPLTWSWALGKALKSEKRTENLLWCWQNRKYKSPNQKYTESYQTILLRICKTFVSYLLCLISLDERLAADSARWCNLSTDLLLWWQVSQVVLGSARVCPSIPLLQARNSGMDNSAVSRNMLTYIPALSARD